MDRTCICHRKSVELICSVGKVILTDQNIQRADWFIRFILNGLFVYFLVERTSVLFIGGIVLLMVLYLAIMHQMVKGKPLNWEYLISEEGKKMMLLYRIANMFVDVPALKERVARRKWLDFILSIIGEKRTYLYLYTRTFLRSGNYFGLYVRLLALEELFFTSFHFIWAIYRKFYFPILNRLSAINFMETSPHEDLA